MPVQIPVSVLRARVRRGRQADRREAAARADRRPREKQDDGPVRHLARLEQRREGRARAVSGIVQQRESPGEERRRQGPNVRRRRHHLAIEEIRRRRGRAECGVDRHGARSARRAGRHARRHSWRTLPGAAKHKKDLAHAKTLIPKLEKDAAARREFGEIILARLPKSVGEEGGWFINKKVGGDMIADDTFLKQLGSPPPKVAQSGGGGATSMAAQTADARRNVSGRRRPRRFLQGRRRAARRTCSTTSRTIR